MSRSLVTLSCAGRGTAVGVGEGVGVGDLSVSGSVFLGTASLECGRGLKEESLDSPEQATINDAIATIMIT